MLVKLMTEFVGFSFNVVAVVFGNAFINRQSSFNINALVFLRLNLFRVIGH